MSETDSFVDEVNDELRRDRLFAQFRRYGPFVILALVAVVAGSAWNEWRKAEAEAARQVAGDAVRKALAAPVAEDRAKALAAITGPGGAQPLPVRFLEAQALAEAGRTGDAVALLKAVGEDAATEPLYRDLARLRLVLLPQNGLAPADRVALLDPMTGPGAPFRLLALEQRAVARIELGEVEKAREDLAAIAADERATQGMKGRAGLLLRAIGGGETPAAPAAPAAPSE